MQACDPMRQFINYRRGLFEMKVRKESNYPKALDTLVGLG